VAAADAIDQVAYLIFLLSGEAGLRCGEMCAEDPPLRRP
jgi:hypothetical protein